MSDKKHNHNETRLTKIINKTVYIIYHIHLYDTKGEALFKIIAFLISWYVGVFLQSSTASYFLFSISIITEYAIKLVTANRFVPKIWPLFLVIINVIVLVISSGLFYKKEGNALQIQESLEIVTVSIILIDAMAMLIIEPPQSNRIECNIASRGDSHN